MEQMIQVVGGIQIRGGMILVGDPGLEREKRIKVKIVSGLYQCNVFLNSKDERIENAIIVQMFILSMDNKPKTKPRIGKIGNISIDSGIAGFVLPEACYEKEVINRIHGANRSIIEKDVGFFSVSGYGDGQYPVISFTDELNRIVGLTIPFI